MSSGGNRPVTSALTKPLLRPCIWSSPLCWKSRYSSAGVRADRWSLREATNRRTASSVQPLLQKGQLLPAPVLWTTLVAHAWSALDEHLHQTRRLEPATTKSGVSPPFFVGCHCAAIAG